MGLSGLDKVYTAQAAILDLPRLMSQASTDAADLLEDVVHAQFASGTDPWGQPWAPLQPSTLKKGRRPPPLMDSGALGAVEAEALQSAGVRLAFPEDYAIYHQEGTSQMSARKLIPDGDSFKASLWYAPVVEAYSNAIYKNSGWRAAGATVFYDKAA